MTDQVTVELKGGSCLQSSFRDTDNPQRLWVGGFNAPMSRDRLKGAGITHILSAAEEWPPKFPSDFDYLHVQLRDETHWNLLSALPEVIHWLENAIGDCTEPSNRVLIHCAQGSSRSGSFAVAYLMFSKQLSFDDALTLARQDRDIIQPNPGFEEQLRYWHSTLKLSLPPIRSDPDTLEFLSSFRKIPLIRAFCKPSST